MTTRQLKLHYDDEDSDNNKLIAVLDVIPMTLHVWEAGNHDAYLHVPLQP